MNITIPGYKIEHLIAEGGTASVYLAIQKSLQRHVAIKLLRKFDNSEQLTRFLNEGQIIALLNHRNVINIHDIGVTDEGRPYISMEYLEGGDLDARIPKQVDPKDALQWLEAIGNYLDFVHRKGIIHRDIRPGNILFHKDGTAILTDHKRCGNGALCTATTITKARKEGTANDMGTHWRSCGNPWNRWHLIDRAIDHSGPQRASGGSSHGCKRSRNPR